MLMKVLMLDNKSTNFTQVRILHYELPICYIKAHEK